MPVEQMTAPMENDWVELNDYHNMVDEQMIEPDYFIDMANPAVYIPDDAGIDKATCLDDRNDPDLFDFQLEVEPILQVLVGKTLEHARIEIIEDFEREQIQRMRDVYKKKREAMLIHTQQLEAYQERRDDERERRLNQQRVTTVLDIEKDKK